MRKEKTVHDKRVTYRRRNPLNTRRNLIKKVKTPGNRLVVHYLKKLHLKHRSVPKCAISGVRLNGCIPNRGNFKNKRLTIRQQRRQPVTRRYGGNMSMNVVRLRIIRAFLSEECRIASKYRKVVRKKTAARKRAKAAAAKDANRKKGSKKKGKSSKGKSKKKKGKK